MKPIASIIIYIAINRRNYICEAKLNHKMDRKREVCSIVEDNRRRRWCDLPLDVLLLILRLLMFLDHLSFRGVCKGWRSASENCPLENQPCSQPVWVMFSKKTTTSNSTWHFGNSATLRVYSIDVPELSRTKSKCLVSKHGWLLLFSSEPTSSLFFFNPFSRSRIDLPWSDEFSGLIESDKGDKQYSPVFTLSTPPTSPDCIMFAITFVNENNVRFSTCRRGENAWTTINYKNQKNKFAPIENAMFTARTGLFYWVDESTAIRAYQVGTGRFWGLNWCDAGAEAHTMRPVKREFIDGFCSYMVEPNDRNAMICIHFNSRLKTFHVELESKSMPERSRSVEVQLVPYNWNSEYDVESGWSETEAPSWLQADTFRAGTWCVSLRPREDVDHRLKNLSWHNYLYRTSRSSRQCAKRCEFENAVWIDPRWIEPAPIIAWTV